MPQRRNMPDEPEVRECSEIQARKASAGDPITPELGPPRGKAATSEPEASYKRRSIKQYAPTANVTAWPKGRKGYAPWRIGRGAADGLLLYGRVAELEKAADCKSVGAAYVGSNPTSPTIPLKSRKIGHRRQAIASERRSAEQFVAEGEDKCGSLD